MGNRFAFAIVAVSGVLQGAHAGPVSHTDPAFSLSVPDGFAPTDAGPDAKELAFHHGDDLITVDWYAPDRAPDPVDPAKFASYHRAAPPKLHRTVEQQSTIPHGQFILVRDSDGVHVIYRGFSYVRGSGSDILCYSDTAQRRNAAVCSTLRAPERSQRARTSAGRLEIDDRVLTVRGLAIEQVVHRM